jgi:hypothetical protein
MKYTVRGIPAALDVALRDRARAAGKSLNDATIDAMMEASGLAGVPRKRRAFSGIAGTWTADKAVEGALSAQDRVDEDLWK